MKDHKSYCVFLALSYLILALVLMYGKVNASPIQQTETDFNAIDAYIEDQMDSLGIPGLALGIVQDNQIVHLQGFGVADSTGRAVTPQTPFYLGSLTKSFTALAVMQLVEAGKINLDAPVQTYLPWFEVADKEASAQITVRHLLNQTTGISTKDGMHDRISQQSLEKMVRRLDTLQLTQPVGTTYQYSNLNYNIAGLIVEVVSEQSYADYVSQHIFELLEMSHSYASRTPALTDGLAEGHIYMFGHVFGYEGVVAPAQIPSGYLIASVEDLSRYAIAQLNDGKFEDVSVLSPQGVAEMHAPAVPIDGVDAQYAMGWFVNTLDGMPIIRHGGVLPDFRCDLILLPGKGLGVILLSNASGFEQRDLVPEITKGIVNMLNGKPAASVSPPVMLRVLYLASLLTPLLQILGILLVWRYRQHINLWGVLLIVILNLTVVFFLFRTSLSQITLSAMLVFHPELGYGLILIAMLGIGWSMVYTVIHMMARRANKDCQSDRNYNLQG